MKSILILILSFAFIQVMLAQSDLKDDSSEEPPESTVAKELPVLLIFSGSDWCKPCIKLKKEVIDTPEFQAFAKDQLQIQIVDFPYKKANKLSKEKQAENNALAEQYNPEGLLPNVLLVDAQGNIIKNIRARTIKRMINELSDKS